MNLFIYKHIQPKIVYPRIFSGSRISLDPPEDPSGYNWWGSETEGVWNAFGLKCSRIKHSRVFMKTRGRARSFPAPSAERNNRALINPGTFSQCLYSALREFKYKRLAERLDLNFFKSKHRNACIPPCGSLNTSA